MRAPDWLTARPIAHRGLHDHARGIVENMPEAIRAAIASGRLGAGDRLPGLRERADERSV